MTENEMLKFAIDSGIVDISTIYQEIKMKEKKKYLSLHKEKIWQASDGRWKTHLPNDKRTLINKKTREELEDRLVEYYKEQEESPCIRNVFKECMEWKNSIGEIKKQTRSAYESNYNANIKDSLLENVKFSDITEELLEEYFNEKFVSGMTHAGFVNTKKLIYNIFKFGRKRKYTEIRISNFFEDLEVPKKIAKPRIKKDEEEVFTREEVQKIINYAYQTKDIRGLLVVFALQTGMRVGEIVALDWDDVKENYIKVEKTEIIYKENNKRVREIQKATKTESSIRKVYYTEELKATIDIIKVITGDKEMVFIWKGDRINTGTAKRYIKRLCENIGIPKRSIHKCRKTYATNLINSNIDEKIIQMQMGHSDIGMTKTKYYYNDKNEQEIIEQLKSINSK